MISGKVIEIFSAKKGQSGLPRPIVEELELIENFGIKGDKFAGKDEEKSVMIVGLNTYETAKEENINLKFGSLGENILFDFNPHDFNIGTKFQVGETIIELTEKCTICNHLAVFDDNLPILVQDCRGLYCKIIKGGKINKNSTIIVLENNKKAS
jgi:MOSC domain-containing protein YiiM